MKFKVGDKVVVIKTEFTDEEWKGIGEIIIDFKIGDEFEIINVFNYGNINKNQGLRFKNDPTMFAYPSIGFELKNEYKPEVINDDLTYLIEFLRVRGIE